MLDGFTLGQYVPVDSLVHRLDPRLKLVSAVFLICGVFSVTNPLAFAAWGAFVLIATKASRLGVGVVVRSARPVLWLLAFTAVLHVFFTHGDVIWEWGIFSITRQGVVLAFRMGLRLFFLVLIAGLLTLTTSPMELSDAMERLFSPLVRFGFPAHEMAMMMTIAMRFIPTLFDETGRIIQAQLSRGAMLDSGGIASRVRAFIPVLVPLFIIVFQRAEELAVAMESRCYCGGAGRTRMNPLVWHVRDTVFLIFILLAVAAMVCFDRVIL